MVNNKVTIVALSVDSRYAVLYLQDGETITLVQGDPRLPRIVEQAKAQKLGTDSDTAIVDLSEIVAKRTEFADAEKGTKGLVKFFRVARKFVKNLLDTESPEKVEEEAAHVSPLEIGVKPGSKVTVQVVDNVEDYAQARNEAEAAATVIVESVDPADPTPPVAKEPTNDQKIDAARERLNMISGNGVDTTHDDFHKPLNEKEETIIAVNTQTGSVIPDAQKLTRQLRQSAKLQNYAGFENFVRRLEHVINDRGHSVEDLMKFIEQGDLPIADDGCIVIFKRLNSRGNGQFVDVHTGNIKQRVGSYVFMRPGLVDPNRRQDCSNGLHVASLSYLSSFSGSVTVIAKVRPEDVFAVPQYSHNKMRVCGYHIIAELPSELKALVNSGNSITGLPAGKQLLHDVLRGNHIAVTQHVEVCGQNGSDVKITDVKPETADQAVKAIVGSSDVLDMSEGLEPVAAQSEPVKPTDLVEQKQKVTPVVKTSKKAKKAKAAKAKAPAKVYTKSGAMLAMFNGLQDAQTSDVAHDLAQKILAMKSGAKKGWDKLGFTTDEVNFVMGSLRKQSNPKAEAMLEAQAKAEKRKESGRAKSGSPASLIRELLDQAPLSKAQYEAILLLKKKAKKGWAALGVTPSEQADIEQHTK